MQSDIDPENLIFDNLDSPPNVDPLALTFTRSYAMCPATHYFFYAGDRNTAATHLRKHGINTDQ